MVEAFGFIRMADETADFPLGFITMAEEAVDSRLVWSRSRGGGDGLLVGLAITGD